MLHSCNSSALQQLSVAFSTPAGKPAGKAANSQHFSWSKSSCSCLLPLAIYNLPRSNLQHCLGKPTDFCWVRWTLWIGGRLTVTFCIAAGHAQSYENAITD